jgi:hypothetical protein
LLPICAAIVRSIEQWEVLNMRNWIVGIISAVALALTLSATPVEARHGWGHHGWGGHHGRHLGWGRGHHYGWRHHRHRW